MLLNVTLGLFCEQVQPFGPWPWDYSGALLAALNAVLWLAYEVWRGKKGRWPARVLAMWAGLAALPMAMEFASGYRFLSEVSGFWSLVACLVISVGAAIVYRRRRLDLFMLSLAAFCLSFIGSAFLWRFIRPGEWSLDWYDDAWHLVHVVEGLFFVAAATVLGRVDPPLPQGGHRVKPLPLSEVLAKLDVPPARAAEVLRAHDAPLPWYVRALTGALGWAAAGSFLAAVNWTTPQPVRFGVGIAALVVALLLRRKFDRGFFGHLALALALFGEAMSIDTCSVLPLSFVGERLFAIGVELVLFVFYRDALMRFMCTIAAWSFGMRLYEDLLPQATVDLPLLVSFAAALMAFRLRRAAFAYGTAFFTFGLMLGTLQRWHPFVLGPYGKWLVAAVLLVEVLLVLREGKAPPKLALAAIAGCFALGAVTLGSPGCWSRSRFSSAAFNRRDTRCSRRRRCSCVLFGSRLLLPACSCRCSRSRACSPRPGSCSCFCGSSSTHARSRARADAARAVRACRCQSRWRCCSSTCSSCRRSACWRPARPCCSSCGRWIRAR